MTDKAIEAAARAMAKRYYHSNGLETLVPFTEMGYSDRYWGNFENGAKAAIAAWCAAMRNDDGLMERVENIIDGVAFYPDETVRNGDEVAAQVINAILGEV